MNVLSIDFDYFPDATADVVRNCYPDGHDTSGYKGAFFSSLLWASHYADETQGERLYDIGIMTDDLNRLKDILKGQESDTPALIAFSHLSIYDFIISNIRDTSEKINIVNIDTHPDMFNDNDIVDCGNWLGHLNREYKCHIEWIANDLSCEMFGLDDDFKSKVFKKDLYDILNEERKFDLIFLCRSDLWLPPHLDYDFKELAKFIDKRFDTRCEKGIMDVRDYEPLVEAERKTRDEMIKFLTSPQSEER